MNYQDKNTLYQYFKEAINREANVEITSLQKEISKLKNEARKSFEDELQEEVETVINIKKTDLIKREQESLVDTQRKLDLEVMAKREELLKKLFLDLEEKIKAYQNTKEYEKWVIDKLKSIDLDNYKEIEICTKDAFIRKLSLKIDIKNNDDLLAGFILYAKDGKTFIDESFKAKIEDAKSWFFEHAKWFSEV